MNPSVNPSQKPNQKSTRRAGLLLAGLALSCSLGAMGNALAADAKLSKDTLQDIERHRAMAQAHEAAAKCLESGKSDDVCELQLRQSCQGLAIGKFCGMKHEH